MFFFCCEKNMILFRGPARVNLAQSDQRDDETRGLVNEQHKSRKMKFKPKWRKRTPLVTAKV